MSEKITRKEAIKECVKIVAFGVSEKQVNAMKLAIAALSAEPCEDVISRQEVLNYIYNDLGLGDEENGKDLERQMELEKSYRYVKSLPPITPQQKIGHWIRHDNGKYNWYLCSCCDAMAGSDEKMMAYKYCPNCGSKMIEPQEKLPPVTPQPKTGKWLITPMSHIAYCSECDHLFKDIPASVVKYFKYCPNCKVKMTESEEV